MAKIYRKWLQITNKWLKERIIPIVKNAEQLGLSYIADRNIKYYSHFGKWFLIKLNIQLSYNLANPTIKYLPK